VVTPRKSTITKNRRIRQRRNIMKNYLTYLYEMELHNNECNPPTVPSYKESTLYAELEKELSKEQFQKVLEFLELHETRLEHECEIYYKKGFRFACRLMIECFNENF
jgi:hypothetical protein